MAYFIGLCVSLIFTATAVSARYDIFDFNIPTNATNATDDVTTLRDTAEENLCAYVGLNCSSNTNTTRPANLTQDIVINNFVDMLASVEKYSNNTKKYGYELFNSTNGRNLLGLVFNATKAPELIRKRSQPCFSGIKTAYSNIIKQNNITQDFNLFITSSFDEKHCTTAMRFNNFMKKHQENITGCDNDTLSIVYDVFEDVRVHLCNSSLTEPDVPVSKSWMILGSIHAILLSLMLVKIY